MHPRLWLLQSVTLVCGAGERTTDDATTTPPPSQSPAPKDPGPARPTRLAIGRVHACMSDDTTRCWGDEKPPAPVAL